MPVSYSYKENIIVLDMSGDYSTDELKNTIASAFRNSDCPDNAVILCDMRKSESIEERSSDEVKDMSKFIASYQGSSNLRICMVTSTDLAYGLMRIGAVFAEMGGMESHVSTDYNEAIGWLQRPRSNNNK